MSEDSADSGFTLVEVMVALLVFTVVLSMVSVSIVGMTRLTIHGTATGMSAETAQSQMQTIEQYLRSAVTPANAAVEYPQLSPSPCGGAGNAVQQAYDYSLELCAAPPRADPCTAANWQSNPAGSACPQLYELAVAGQGSCSTDNVCTLSIQDLSVTGSPVVWQTSAFRCPSSCQADLGTGSGHQEQNGADPPFPYLFSYYGANGAQVTGATPSAVQSIEIDMQILVAPVGGNDNKTYTELRDTVWLAGASSPST